MWTLDALADIYRLSFERGYTNAFFTRTPPDGPFIYWRHDVDFCPYAALAVATMECQLGVWSTFFFRRDAPFYNMRDPVVDGIETSILRMRHRVGVHASRGDDELDIYAAHKPSPDDLGGSDPYNAYADHYFGDECKYLSDSQQRFREGPLEAFLDPDRYPRLQINLHPEWWYYDGDTPAAVALSWVKANAERMALAIVVDQELGPL